MTRSARIRLTGAYAGQAEVDAMAATVSRGHLAAGGEYSSLAEDLIEQVCETACVSLASSGTTAMEVGALALDLSGESEVIVPAFTFVTTASAFARCGARIRFADIDPKTLTLDPRSVEEQIGDRTAAVVAMHYGGIACDMNSLQALVDRSRAVLIEDNAHGFAGRYLGQPLGSLGLFSILSFDWAKNITCGEGGALLSGNDDFAHRVEEVGERGTNRLSFLRGEVDSYEWTGLGTNADLSELSAAFLYEQLRRLDEIQGKRRNIWNAHDEALGPWAEEVDAQLPHVPADCVPAYHIYYVLLPDLETRNRFIDHLGQFGVQSAFHYMPLHRSPFGKALTDKPSDCPNAEEVSDRIARIPCHPGLSEADLDAVHEAVTSFTP